MTEFDVTDVRITLPDGRYAPGKLRAYANVVLFGQFVVHDIRIVQGSAGLIVAMPSRKAIRRCLGCGSKSSFSDSFCGHCGTRIDGIAPQSGDGGESPRMYFDVCHPITPECRKSIDAAIFAAYWIELGKPRDEAETDAERPIRRVRDAATVMTGGRP